MVDETTVLPITAETDDDAIMAKADFPREKEKLKSPLIMGFNILPLFIFITKSFF